MGDRYAPTAWRASRAQGSKAPATRAKRALRPGFPPSPRSCSLCCWSSACIGTSSRRGWPVQTRLALCGAALLMPQVNPGSLYRCGKGLHLLVARRPSPASPCRWFSLSAAVPVASSTPRIPRRRSRRTWGGIHRQCTWSPSQRQPACPASPHPAPSRRPVPTLPRSLPCLPC